MPNPLVIAIVDDDEAVREAISDLLQVEGYTTRTFANAGSFLSAEADMGFGCLVSDIRMPEIDGIQLQQRLRSRGSTIPVIFITSSVGTTSRPQAMRDGAVAWFTKPVADEALLDALRWALCGDDPPGSSDS